MSRRRALAAAALLALSGTARGFVRETTVVGDPASGRCLWWGDRDLNFQVNATSAAAPPGGRPACPDCAPCLDATGATAAAAIEAGLAIWGGATRSGDALACTDLGFTSGGATTKTAMGNDGVNLVVFRTGWCAHTSVVPAADPCRATVGACAAKYNCWEHDAGGTLALTTTTFRTRDGKILDADVEFHGWDGNVPANGYYLTCGAALDPSCGPSPWGPPPATGCTAVDVASLALHEAGHVLGLDHTTPISVMQPTLPYGSTRLDLDPDDVEGICTIYPAGAATLTCGSDPIPEPVGGCGCGSGNGALGLALALLAAFRARRRRG